MSRFYWILLLSVCLLPDAVKAQSTVKEANALLDAAQIRFKSFLQDFHGDQGIKMMLYEFCDKQVDSLQTTFNERTHAADPERIKSINAIKYFLQSLGAALERHYFEPYDVPDALEKFPLIADAIVNGTSFRDYALDFGARRTQIMADAFRQFPEGKRLQHAADARRVAVNPPNLLPLLERQPDFIYTDTALIYVAEHSPMSLIDYIATKNNHVTDTIRAMNHPMLNVLAGLVGNRNATEIAPFAGEIAAGKFTEADILKLRSTDVRGYYQLLVNTIQENRRTRLAGGPGGMLPALRNTLKEKAIAFYVRPINELHEAKDPVRFAYLQNLRTIDLYYLIISGEEELYTSSFMGVYKRIVQGLPEGRADSLFEFCQNDQFRKFIRICAHYNVLTDFLSHMPDTTRVNLLSRFIAGIGENTDSGLEDAMDVADAFVSLSVDTQYSATVRELLVQNRTKCEQLRNYYGIRLYKILLDVFDMAYDRKQQQAIFSKLGNYELLSLKSIRDKNGIINQLVIFYGDEDGKTSFQNFLALFKDSKTWEVCTCPQWVEINAICGSQPVRIFANRPLDHKNNEDENAQEALLQFLQRLEIKPGIMIHRGHSYHLATTLNYLQPSMKLAILGSCGGYKNILTVADKSPSAQIIATKQIGSKLINDPMIQYVNENLINGQDIYWPELWTTMGKYFGSTEFTRDLFTEYVPPYRNLSLFVIRLYNFDDRSF
jgi:hypothetical protein